MTREGVVPVQRFIAAAIWGVCALLVTLATAGAQNSEPEEPALPQWTKSWFLEWVGDPYPNQKAYLKSVQEWLGHQWNERSDCVAYLRDYESLVLGAVRAGGNISSRYIASWKYCAAKFFPADTPGECKASVADYRKLAARDRRFLRSRLPEYLESFCGVALPKQAEPVTASVECKYKAALYETQDPANNDRRKIWLSRTGVTRSDYARTGSPIQGRVYEIVLASGDIATLHGPSTAYMFPVEDMEVLRKRRGEANTMSPIGSTPREFRIVLGYMANAPERLTYRFVRCEEPPRRK